MIIYYTAGSGELNEIELTIPYCLDRPREQREIIEQCAAFAYQADKHAWPKLIRLFKSKEDHKKLRSFAERLVGFDLVPEFYTYER